jgi:hypothetical protein
MAEVLERKRSNDRQIRRAFAPKGSTAQSSVGSNARFGDGVASISAGGAIIGARAILPPMIA